ncbi:MAG: hypothetical protein U9Q08_04420 [Candidatus Omnitrophota bacterium]|nr:hypothetical protein [Candidatus Omnitrophota bacterium]
MIEKNENSSGLKQLGQLLLAKDIINNQQLETALNLQKKEGGYLGEILVRFGYTSEEKIVITLAEQYGYPYLSLANCQIAPELIKLVPENVARQYYAIPVDKIGEVLTIVIADPTNNMAINDLEYITKCRIQVFVGTATEIREAINHYYKSEKLLGTEGKPEDHVSRINFRGISPGKKKPDKDG